MKWPGRFENQKDSVAVPRTIQWAATFIAAVELYAMLPNFTEQSKRIFPSIIFQFVPVK
ncbi:hypothetical protein [Paenibacillus sp. 22594]|uniref:hypothetical protein n=1 Tax=Paenibacillus sp. 22594 TaxID=3453947 RepID=UPI003F861256